MRKITLTIVTVFVTVSLNAQKIKYSYGIKAGVNISNLSLGGSDIYFSNGGANYDSKIDFHIGGFVNLYMSKKLAIQPELLFSKQGGKQSFDFDDSSFVSFEGVENRYDYYYLTLPFIFKYYITKKLSIHSGPQISALLQSKIKTKIDDESQTDNIEDVKTIDFGVNFGAGYELKSNIFFDFRYILGLSNTIKSDNSLFENLDYSEKNSVFQISVGYKF